MAQKIKQAEWALLRARYFLAHGDLQAAEWWMGAAARALLGVC